MKKQKFYVVWNGRKPGIYINWADCQAQVEKFEGAAYKAFENQEEAKEAFASDAKKYIYNKKNRSGKPGKLLLADKPEKKSVSVDAAWNTRTKLMEYQGVFTATGEKLFIQGPFRDATNNIGEFLAIVHALALLRQKNSALPIYSDSMTAIKWVKDKKANTKLLHTECNAELFDLISRAEKWLSDNAYTNRILKWDTESWGEIPADFGRK
ncbi:MAG TPA: ribonuclease H family protein [Bacteroidales bacterium]|nr:ribonuclease H family protein [Bacteroidales bacterium]